MQATDKNKCFTRLRSWAALAVLGCVVTVAVGEKKQVTTTTTSPTAKKKVEPGFEKGTFHRVADRVGGLLKLTWKGKSLQLDCEHWGEDLRGKSDAEALKFLYAEIRRTNRGISKVSMVYQAKAILRSVPPEGAFLRLRAAAGKLRSADIGSVGPRRFNAFTTRQLKGRLDYGGGGLFKVVLEEKNSPHRTIDFRDEGGGTLVIALSDKSGRLSLTIKQDDKGRFDVKHVAGEEVFSDREKSFSEFYRKHRRYVNERLFPLLEHVGIAAPLTPYSARHKNRIMQVALARIRGLPTPEQTARGKSLIEQLNDNSFKKRQEATKALSANVALYRDLIEQTIKQASTPPEVSSRLKLIVKAKPRQDPIEEFVTAQGLVADTGYLVWLLGESPPADRAAVAKVLERITKQKLGPDPAAWKKWWLREQAAGSAATRPK